MVNKRKSKEFTPSFRGKKTKKHTILGGVKVSSSQLSEWGSLGGRPTKYSSNAERQRAKRLRKKQEQLGLKAQLRDYKSYGEVQIKARTITCPNCGKIETDLRQYFTDRGELIKETYWFDTVKREKFNIKENKFHCKNCSYVYSFYHEKIAVKEEKKVELRAGSSGERVRKWRERKEK